MTPGFQHDAVFYRDEREFVDATLPFIRDGVAAREAVMVAVDAGKAHALTAALGGAAEAVVFVDMERLGRNPARIIPAWEEFVRTHVSDGKPGRGIGEPAWPGRSAEELVECDHHESLLNLAFGRGPAWWLRCPYDASRLDPAVLDAARRNHPLLVESGSCRESDEYVAPDQRAGPFTGPLPEPPAATEQLWFTRGHLRAVRDFVAEHARRLQLDERRTGDLLIAVNELATNSLLHGGGAGVVRAWTDGDALVCEVRDRGRIDRPLTGRERPRPERVGGRGLWMVNHLCDLVQIRSGPAENVIRVRMRTAPDATGAARNRQSVAASSPAPEHAGCNGSGRSASPT
jgi:anti-sigma regulatory factor (Ser/Thr protein kinase)